LKAETKEKGKRKRRRLQFSIPPAGTSRGGKGEGRFSSAPSPSQRVPVVEKEKRKPAGSLSGSRPSAAGPEEGRRGSAAPFFRQTSREKGEGIGVHQPLHKRGRKGRKGWEEATPTYWPPLRW